MTSINKTFVKLIRSNTQGIIHIEVTREKQTTGGKMINTRTSFLMLYFFIFSTSPANAYLDPGTGSLILQVALGGLAGIAILGKLFWNRFKSLFQFGKHKNAGEKETVGKT
jgi:hypothetical protein